MIDQIQKQYLATLQCSMIYHNILPYRNVQWKSTISHMIRSVISILLQAQWGIWLAWALQQDTAHTDLCYDLKMEIC